MAKMSLTELKALLEAERNDALAAIAASKLPPSAPTRWTTSSAIWRRPAGAAAGIAKIVFFVFIVLFLLSLLFGGFRGGFGRRL